MRGRIRFSSLHTLVLAWDLPPAAQAPDWTEGQEGK